MRLCRVPHLVRVRLGLLHQPLRLLARALPHGRGLLLHHLEQPPGPMPEFLVRLRVEFLHHLPQPLRLHIHLPGEHGEPGGPLPGGVTVPEQVVDVGVDLFGTVATPSYDHEVVERDRCAAHP
ncbi:hypothetical protein [Streptomyces sp. NBC_00443]|uniref:hypothetical protein n=1 Tax=Streptomyces sp. NBC_00443 TaxID=2975743 RepID=UPI002E2177A8